MTNINDDNTPFDRRKHKPIDERLDLLEKETQLHFQHDEKVHQRFENYMSELHTLAGDMNDKLDDVKEFMEEWNGMKTAVKVMHVIGRVIAWIIGTAVGIGALYALIRGK